MPPRNETAAELTSPARRRFWGELLGEVLSLHESLKGIPQQSLQEIGQVPDAVLREMIPVWTESLPLDLRGDGLYRRCKDGDAVCAYAFAEHDKDIVDQFNCGRNIEVISGYLASSSGLEPTAAFEAAKTLFVRFCRRGWCHPAAAHFSSEGDCR